MLECESRMLWTLAELIKRYAEIGSEKRQMGKEKQAIHRVRQYIHEHFAESVTLNTLAQHVSLSPYYLLRAFRAEVGMPPYAYLESVRIQRTQQLIKAGKALAEVAAEAGFSSQSHMTRQFKKIIGVTPGQYAQQFDCRIYRSMTPSLLSILSYILISSFTPGPSNISSASMAVLHGYKNTLRYQAGLAVGVFLLMLLSGLLSTTLAKTFPAFEPIMRYAGAAISFTLPLGFSKPVIHLRIKRSKPLGFVHGLVLQIVNPKLIVYAFTFFSAFLATTIKNFSGLLLVVLFLTLVAFCAASTWALFGTAIKSYLRNPALTRAINILLSLALVYTAISLTGIL